MNFSLTEEQKMLRTEALKFAQRELNENVFERDKDGIFSREAWKKCGSYGIQGLPIPPAYGGSGLNPTSIVLILEGLGYGCRDYGLLFSLCAHMFAVEIPILRFGTESQKTNYLPKLSTGEWIGAHAITEPDSGSDAMAMSCKAERHDNHYILNGRKTFVTNAPHADIFLVFATINKSLGYHGITAFLVEREFEGFQIESNLDKMGLRTSPMADIILEKCKVPIENRLGEEGKGAQIFSFAMDWERALILSPQLGEMERQIDDCIKYAKLRLQFGRKISSFQAVSNKIVDMKVSLEASRLLVYKTAWLLEQNEQSSLMAAIAKLLTSESAVKVNLDAIQIHGGYGYMSEFEIERGLRDAVASTVYSGTSEMQRVLIATLLRL